MAATAARSMGQLIVGKHLARLLGVDLTWEANLKVALVLTHLIGRFLYDHILELLTGFKGCISTEERTRGSVCPSVERTGVGISGDDRYPIHWDLEDFSHYLGRYCIKARSKVSSTAVEDDCAISLKLCYGLCVVKARKA